MNILVFSEYQLHDKIIYPIWEFVWFKGLAPEMGLYGLHARFFKFDEGCSIDDCRPNADAGASKKIAMSSVIVWIITVLTILLGNGCMN